MIPILEPFDSFSLPGLVYWRLFDVKQVACGVIDDVYTVRNEINTQLEKGDWNFPDSGDAYADTCYDLVFKEMACSYVTVAAIAPIFETMFCKAALAYRQMLRVEHPPTERARWKLADDAKWSPYCLWTKDGAKTNLIEGFFQLLGAIDQTNAILPKSKRIICALFAYRNQALHRGYEWESDDVAKFAKRLKAEGWDDLFFVNRKGGTNTSPPWLIWMTDVFIKRSLDELDTVAAALRDVAKNLSEAKSA